MSAADAPWSWQEEAAPTPLDDPSLAATASLAEMADAAAPPAASPPTLADAAENAGLAESSTEEASGDLAPEAPPALVEQIARYRIAPGDTLTAIAARFGISVDTLRWANPLVDPNRILAGQELTVLPVTGVLYRAAPGDTPASVAGRYGLPLADIAAANGLAEPYALAAGQPLLIPGGRPQPLPAAATDWALLSRGAGGEQRFIEAATAAARASQQATGVPASVTIAQAILESDWGRSQLARKANNYFGIKATSGAAADSVYWIGAWEVLNGEDVMSLELFRAYGSAAESFADHGLFFLRNPRYWPALRVAQDPRAFAQAIADAGYATDPAYAAKLIRIMDQWNLYQYDRGA